MDNSVSAVDAFNTLRSCLESNDEWKIDFRGLYEETYTALWRSLLRIGKVNEALLVAEQGRAQALSDNFLTQYKLPAAFLSGTKTYTKAKISCLFTELSTPTVFLAIEGLNINIWFLTGRNKVVF